MITMKRSQLKYVGVLTKHFSIFSGTFGLQGASALQQNAGQIAIGHLKGQRK